MPAGTSVVDRPVEDEVPRISGADPASLPMDLETALQWTLSSNPDLIAIRQNLWVSAEALAVAHCFPTSLNPSVSVEVRPWVFERMPGDGVERLQTLVSVTWKQPVELGHRTAHRVSIARAAYDRTQWNILQAELLALAQTYRSHQTATYRREKLRVAGELADFSNRLLQALQRQMEANRIAAADVLLAEVENRATGQRVEIARQEYAAALAELRQQIGIPEYAASVEPAGELKPPAPISPGDENALIQTALESRPEIQAARAQVAGSYAAVCLARAERIPVLEAGPSYEHDETGISFYGLAVSTPVPVLNGGRPLVRLREAEYCRDVVALEQLQRRTAAQVRAGLVKWDQSRQVATRIDALIEPIQSEADRMEQLFEAGQADLLKLLQVRQRLLEAQNAHLDAVWQATQAYADLLTALGGTPLIGSLSAQTESGSAAPAK